MADRILVLCHEYPPIGGGAGAVAAALCREYVATGNSVVVVTMAWKTLPLRELSEGIEIIRLNCDRRRKEMTSVLEGLKWTNAARKLVKRLHQEKPFTVTHAHFVMPAGIVAERLKKQAGVPYLITLHGSDVPGHNQERFRLIHPTVHLWWQHICFAADLIVSPSASLLQLFAKSAHITHGRVIANGFGSDQFKPAQKKPQILLCGRLIKSKGFQYFLEAIQDLELPGWSVDIVGDGPLFDQLEDLALKCRIPVRMRGWVNNADPLLAELYGSAKIFVFPSEWENLSISLLEAMGAGCAVIASDVPGNLEALGDTGFLVPSADVPALRNAVVKLTKTPELCLEMGESASQRARARYKWATIARRYLAAFEEIKS